MSPVRFLELQGPLVTCTDDNKRVTSLCEEVRVSQLPNAKYVQSRGEKFYVRYPLLAEWAGGIFALQAKGQLLDAGSTLKQAKMYTYVVLKFMQQCKTCWSTFRNSSLTGVIVFVSVMPSTVMLKCWSVSKRP